MNNRVTPELIEMPGWKQKLPDFSAFDKLPDNFLEYITLVETATARPVKIISLGPGREQTIVR
jgi:adenylosuccinate synthase